MTTINRSGCPINLTLEALGDRWSLVIIRDLMFGGKKHFRDLLARSREGIASNILADRIKRLLGSGLIVKQDDPAHAQKAVYALTEKSIQLVPLIVQMAIWGRKHLAVTEELAMRARLLEEGGPTMWEAYAQELRAVHIHAAGEPTPIKDFLDTAFEAAAPKS